MIKILCLGDSLTNGARNEYFRDYPLELSQFITEKSKTPNICINDSVNGETSSEILKRAFKILEKNQFNLSKKKLKRRIEISLVNFRMITPLFSINRIHP